MNLKLRIFTLLMPQNRQKSVNNCGRGIKVCGIFRNARNNYFGMKSTLPIWKPERSISY